ncbi:hypothetical protein IW262DRAFT_1486450 [Armillaria fumosa]|nr:hypothetical protein IW262DRAFT_1486450 [Armillaria fumosa]
MTLAQGHWHETMEVSPLASVALTTPSHEWRLTSPCKFGTFTDGLEFVGGAPGTPALSFVSIKSLGRQSNYSNFKAKVAGPVSVGYLEIGCSRKEGKVLYLSKTYRSPFEIILVAWSCADSFNVVEEISDQREDKANDKIEKLKTEIPKSKSIGTRKLRIQDKSRFAYIEDDLIGEALELETKLVRAGKLPTPKGIKQFGPSYSLCSRESRGQEQCVDRREFQQYPRSGEVGILSQNNVPGIFSLLIRVIRRQKDVEFVHVMIRETASPNDVHRIQGITVISTVLNYNCEARFDNDPLIEAPVTYSQRGGNAKKRGCCVARAFDIQYRII